MDGAGWKLEERGAMQLAHLQPFLVDLGGRVLATMTVPRRLYQALMSLNSEPLTQAGPSGTRPTGGCLVTLA